MITSENVQPEKESPGEDQFYPMRPFEKIAIAISGGGYRATTYGLGVLSQLHSLKLDDEGEGSTLLEKVVYGSSTSGGTITLSVYAASVHAGLSFHEFYEHLNSQLKGEQIVHEAIRLLRDDREWEGLPKSRNVINAFSKVYHDRLFSIMGTSNERVLASLIHTNTHLKEVCFNATEFYTGIPFKFQMAGGWRLDRGGRIGNNNIRINSKAPDAEHTLEQLRLSDVLACSSCFPTGFEPMVYPRDFTYHNGPDIESLRSSFSLQTWSTDHGKEPDKRSKRAELEKKFAVKGEFSIMDGGIVDNQGLDALIEANEREDDDNDGSGNRFDLIMVCDVASFYMDPYANPEIDTSKPWMQKTLDSYWNKFTSITATIRNVISAIVTVTAILAVLFLLPLLLDERGVAEILLALVGLSLFVAGIILSGKIRKLVSKDSPIGTYTKYKSISALTHDKLPANQSFQNRVLGKMAEYIEVLPLGVIMQMIMSRVQSSQVMIGEIFLKHVRRLIFNQLYTLPKLKYRRMNNVIYQLTFTNDSNRRRPAFEGAVDITRIADEARRRDFLQEWESSIKLTDDMKTIAELAYNTGTTLWFEEAQESTDPFKNNRRALIATGQFTTCYNLLGYTLSLKHSRNFNRLDQRYKDRIHSILSQLKIQLEKFAADPFWMEKEFHHNKS